MVSRDNNWKVSFTDDFLSLLLREGFDLSSHLGSDVTSASDGADPTDIICTTFYSPFAGFRAGDPAVSHLNEGDWLF